MESYLANFIPLLCSDTLWYALPSWPSCSSISELHCSVARLSGSRSILNWSLTPPFQSTLILFGKIVQSRTSSSSWSCSKMWDIDFVHKINVLIVSRIFGLGMPSYFDQCKRIHNDPRMRQLKVSERKECDRWAWQSRFQISLPQNQDMDELDLEGRRSIVRRKYAELRADHPKLPEVLRDFQVREACLIAVKELNGC